MSVLMLISLLTFMFLYCCYYGNLFLLVEMTFQEQSPIS